MCLEEELFEVHLVLCNGCKKAQAVSCDSSVQVDNWLKVNMLVRKSVDVINVMSVSNKLFGSAELK